MKLFDEIPYLENEYVILKKIEKKDAQALGEMSEDMLVRRYLPSFLFEYGFSDKGEAIEKMYGDIFIKKQSLHLGIYLKQEPCELAGIAEFYNYDPNWNKVSIGIRLRRKFQGRGIAKRAIALQMDYLLGKTDVKRITAHIMTENVPSVRVLERLGFRMRQYGVSEDWGLESPAIVNKYVYEKWGNISFAKIGSGEKTMVILPGLDLKSTLGAAGAIAQAFAMFKDYTIYLFDDRSRIGENYTLRERAGDVAAEMKSLGLDNAYVYGASMGAMVGQYLAIDHPELVGKLFISSTMSRPNETAVNTLKSWRKLALEGDCEKLCDAFLKQIYSEETANRYGDLFKKSAGEVTADELHKFVILIDAILNVNTYDELWKIKCPVYVVVSLGDKVITDKGGREIADKLNCRMHVYGPQYGHAVYDEAPDHIKRLYDFFAGASEDEDER